MLKVEQLADLTAPTVCIRQGHQAQNGGNPWVRGRCAPQDPKGV